MHEYLRWGNPGALTLLWLTPLLVALYVYAARARQRALLTLATPRALGRIAAADIRRRRRLRAVLMTGALVLLVVAGARPQLGTKMARVERRGVDVLFAVDTSSSMLARDVPPDRLTAAKDAVRAVIGRMDGDRVGIVAFAGDAFLYCPLTIDYGAALMFLDAMDTSVVGDPGTGLADAIRQAGRGFEAAEHSYRHLVILSDGEDHEGGAVDAAREAHEAGVTIHVVGVGGTAGEPIPEVDSEGQVVGHKRDQEGKVILSGLDEEGLRAIAKAGGGIYVSAADGTIPVQRIVGELQRAEGRIVGTYQFTEYQERFQVPLGLAIVLIAMHAVMGDVRRREP